MHLLQVSKWDMDQSEKSKIGWMSKCKFFRSEKLGEMSWSTWVTDSDLVEPVNGQDLGSAAPPHDRYWSLAPNVQDGIVRILDILASLLERGRKWRCVVHLYIQPMALIRLDWSAHIISWTDSSLYADLNFKHPNTTTVGISYLSINVVYCNFSWILFNFLTYLAAFLPQWI